MKTIFVVLGLLLQIIGSYSLIIPDEIPTLLSVIYSNIPTIKKGTDSRVGWGFRFGDRADFQVLVELGPQTNTQPLANQGTSTTNKRNVPNNLRNTLYAQQQARKKHISNTEGGKWIDQWSQEVEKTPQAQILPVASKPGLGIGEIDAKSVIPDDDKKAPSPSSFATSLMLDKLYSAGQKDTSGTTQKPKTTTSFEEALDNVQLDP